MPGLLCPVLSVQVLCAQLFVSCACLPVRALCGSTNSRAGRTYVQHWCPQRSHVRTYTTRLVPRPARARFKCVVVPKPSSRYIEDDDPRPKSCLSRRICPVGSIGHLRQAIRNVEEVCAHTFARSGLPF